MPLLVNMNLRENIKKELTLLNENTCQCYAGTTKMSCHTGPPNYNNYWVHHQKCCSPTWGGTNFTPHPMCHDMHCGNLDNSTCFDGMTTGPTGGGVTGLVPSHTIDGEERPEKDFGILKDKKVDSRFTFKSMDSGEYPDISIDKKHRPMNEHDESPRLPEKFYDSDYELDEFDLDEIFDEMRKGDRVRYFVDVYYDTMLPSSGDPEKDKILAEKMARADMMNLKNREYIIGPVELRGYYR
tara:strand:+ start:30515 stop:31234 length:720 start_codon:yes stop_codon:yes gene_type:complete